MTHHKNAKHKKPCPETIRLPNQNIAGELKKCERNRHPEGSKHIAGHLIWTVSPGRAIEMHNSYDPANGDL